VGDADTPSEPPADEHMHFTRMDQGTDADFQVLKKVHERNLAALPDVLFDMLSDLSADSAYNLNRRDHCLQTATRALRDGADEEMVVVALFHDVGESLGPLNHGEVAAAILRPFISEDNYWLLAHHPLFQTYFYATHLGLDPAARETSKGIPPTRRPSTSAPTGTRCRSIRPIPTSRSRRSNPWPAGC
jgi:HD domain